MARQPLGETPTRELKVRVPGDLALRVSAAATDSGFSQAEWIRAALAHALAGCARPQRRAEPELAEVEACHHPHGMRIGGICTLCGKKPGK